MTEVMVQTPLVLSSLELYGISTIIYEGLLCIACMTGRVELLKYFLAFKQYLMRLAGSYLRPLQLAIRRTYPNVATWSVILNEGLYLDIGSRFDPTHSPGVQIKPDLSHWAYATLSTCLPPTEPLLDFLLDRGFVITDNFFNSAISRTNAEFIQWLLTKCDHKVCTGSALFSAVLNSPQMVDVILNTGIDVNFASGPGCDDPFRRTPGGVTALHEAADRRRADVVRLLLERGADKFARNTWGQTAEDVAAQQIRGPYLEIVHLIHDFEPSSETYILPPEPGNKLVEVLSKGKHWRFIEKKLDLGLLIDFS